MKTTEVEYKFGQTSIKVVGVPGSGTGQVISDPLHEGLSHAEAVAIDVMESVMLSLHSKGLLTTQVVEALQASYEAVENNVHQLGSRAKVDAHSSAYARFVKEVLHCDEHEFDDQVMIATSDGPGAFVSSWTWVTDGEVTRYLLDVLMTEYGTLDVLERYGINSLEDAVEEDGIDAVYEKIKGLIPVRNAFAPARPRENAEYVPRERDRGG